MIPRDYITQWRDRAPWSEDFQVEQDLIISRALIEMFSDPVLAGALAFRGGTALYKLYLTPPARYSEDWAGHLTPVHQYVVVSMYVLQSSNPWFGAMSPA